MNDWSDHGHRRLVNDGGMVDGDGGAVKGNGHRRSGSPDEGVGGSLVGDGGVGVRHGGGGRHGPHLLHVLHVVCRRLGVGNRVHEGVRDGANGGGSLMCVDGGRRVGGVGGRRGGHNTDDCRRRVSVVVMNDGGRGGREGTHPLQDRTADASDAGEDLRRRDREAGREEEDEKEGLKRSVRLSWVQLGEFRSRLPLTIFAISSKASDRGFDPVGSWMGLMSSFGSLCEFILFAAGQRSLEWPARRAECHAALVVPDLLLVAHDAPISHSVTAPAEPPPRRRHHFVGSGGNRESWVSHVASSSGRTDTCACLATARPISVRPRPSLPVTDVAGAAPLIV